MTKNILSITESILLKEAGLDVPLKVTAQAQSKISPQVLTPVEAPRPILDQDKSEIHTDNTETGKDIFENYKEAMTQLTDFANTHPEHVEEVRKILTMMGTNSIPIKRRTAEFQRYFEEMATKFPDEFTQPSQPVNENVEFLPMTQGDLVTELHMAILEKLLLSVHNQYTIEANSLDIFLENKETSRRLTYSTSNPKKGTPVDNYLKNMVKHKRDLGKAVGEMRADFTTLGFRSDLYKNKNIANLLSYARNVKEINPDIPIDMTPWQRHRHNLTKSVSPAIVTAGGTIGALALGATGVVPLVTAAALSNLAGRYLTRLPDYTQRFQNRRAKVDRSLPPSKLMTRETKTNKEIQDEKEAEEKEAEEKKQKSSSTDSLHPTQNNSL